MAADKRGIVAEGRNGPGRPKGASNKITRDIKEAIARAFEAVGGEEYLVTIAREDPKTFCALLGKMIPVQMTGDGGGPLVLTWQKQDES